MHRCGSNLGVTELGQIAIVTEAYKLYRKNYIRELIAAMKDLNKRELNKKISIERWLIMSCHRIELNCSIEEQFVLKNL